MCTLSRQCAADIHVLGLNGVPASQLATKTTTVYPSASDLKVDSTLVLVDVLVTDEDGRTLNGLKSGKFRILDNGKPQNLASVAPTTAPITPVILLEYSAASYNYFGIKGATWATQFLGQWYFGSATNQ